MRHPAEQHGPSGAHAGPVTTWVGRWKDLVVRAVGDFVEDGGGLLAAALAFHTLLSLAPLVIISVAIAGVVLGRGIARAEATELLRQSMGDKMADTINSWVDQASRGSEIASVVGIALVLFAASRLGEQLRNALNQIFNVKSAAGGGIRSVVTDYVRQRLFAFVLVAASGPLLVAVFLSRALLGRFHGLIFPQSAWAVAVVQILQIVFTLVLVGLGSALVLRTVPDRRVAWRPALVGGCVISVLFNAGNVLMGLYLSSSGVGAAYGIASSAVVVLLWLQFSSATFLLGAELTQVYAESLATPG
jgi:membrane protein